MLFYFTHYFVDYKLKRLTFICLNELSDKIIYLILKEF